MVGFKNILVPTDYSKGAEKAGFYGISLAKQFDAKLHILNVIDERLIDAAFFDNIAAEHEKMKLHKVREKTSWRRMEELRKKLTEKAPDVRILEKIIRGIAFVDIVQYAQGHAIDLIVMGSHGKSNLINMLLGSTTEKVIRKAPCAVLAVRPQERDFVLP